jgi:hypothetical protein
MFMSILCSILFSFRSIILMQTQLHWQGGIGVLLFLSASESEQAAVTKQHMAVLVQANMSLGQSSVVNNNSQCSLSV